MSGANATFSGLRRQVWIYFAPALMIVLCVGAYLIFEAENEHLRYRVSAAVFLALASLAAIPFLFIRNIVKPLEEVLGAARKITEGYLDHSVPIRNRDEIGKIGEQINALSANLQEILLHVWNHSRDSVGFLERISLNIRSHDGGRIPPDIEADIASVRHSMEQMKAMVKTFEYYDIRMDVERLMSGEDPNRIEKEKIS